MAKKELLRSLNTAETKKYRSRSDMALSFAMSGGQGSGNGSVIKSLKKISDSLTSDISKKYETIFGNSPSWRQWMVEGERAEEIVSRQFIKSKGLASYRRKLKSALKQIWLDRYQEIMQKYSGAVGNYKTNPSYRSHYARKKRASGGGLYGGSWQRSASSSSGVKYVSPGLMTGYLRRSISDGISSSIDGSAQSTFKVGASPVQIASVSSIEEGKDPKYMNAFYFLNRMIKGSKGYSGISEFKRQRLFYLKANQMRDVSQIMSDAVANDFIPELRDIVANLKNKG
jgi:hypothetical protein